MHHLSHLNGYYTPLSAKGFGVFSKEWQICGRFVQSSENFFGSKNAGVGGGAAVMGWGTNYNRHCKSPVKQGT
jgi:hypothetical protein